MVAHHDDEAKERLECEIPFGEVFENESVLVRREIPKHVQKILELNESKSSCPIEEFCDAVGGGRRRLRLLWLPRQTEARF